MAALNATQIAAYVAWYQDNPIPTRNSPGIVVASATCSILGAITVLALLGARTSNVGRRNMSLLLLASLAMSGVSIWSMHFIGIHFELQPADGLTWHLALSPLWLSLSFLVPLATISIAFLVLGSQDQLSAVRCVVAGVLAGLIVVLMHASANFNLSFRIEYSPGHMVVAGFLACIGCSVALLLFFYARARWIETLPKRFACACLLAAAATGMHFVAAKGTSYFCRDDPALYIAMSNDDGRRWLILVGALDLAFCTAAIGYVVWSTRAASRQRARASGQIIVAFAAFDKNGLLMTTATGALPSRIIETTATAQQVLEAINHRTPAFRSTVLLTQKWSIIHDALPRLAHIVARVQAPAPLTVEELPEGFRPRFVETAAGLAREMMIKLDDVGELFDRAIPIGIDGASQGDGAVEKALPDIEAARAVKGRGLLLVLVRRLPSEGVVSPTRFAAQGYRFTSARHIAAPLGRHLAMDADRVGTLLGHLHAYAVRHGRHVVFEPKAVYVSIVATRATQHGGETETLVFASGRAQVPTWRLGGLQGLSPDMRAWLDGHSGSTLGQISRSCAAVTDSGRRQPDNPMSGLLKFQLELGSCLVSILETTAVWPGVASSFKLASGIELVPATFQRRSGSATCITFHGTLSTPQPGQTPIPRSYSPFHAVDSHGLGFVPSDEVEQARWMAAGGRTAQTFATDAQADFERAWPLVDTQSASQGRAFGRWIARSPRPLSAALPDDVVADRTYLPPFLGTRPSTSHTRDSDYEDEKKATAIQFVRTIDLRDDRSIYATPSTNRTRPRANSGHSSCYSPDPIELSPHSRTISSGDADITGASYDDEIDDKA